MKATVEVRDKAERDALRLGLEDEELRAQVVVLGVLKGVQDNDARMRVIEYMARRFGGPLQGA